MRYDFICTKCEAYTELDMKLKEYEEKTFDTTCPECGEKEALKRTYTKPVNFQLKGFGWADQGYGITDSEMRRNNLNDQRLEDRARKEQGSNSQ